MNSFMYLSVPAVRRWQYIYDVTVEIVNRDINRLCFIAHRKGKKIINKSVA